MSIKRKDQLVKLIQKQKNEDYRVLKEIEKIFINKRSYVFKMPSPGSRVVSLMSGGLDTTIVTALLLEQYGLKVYPVHFDRGFPHSKKVMKSVKYFASYFKQRYPGLFNPVKVLKYTFPSETIHEQVTKNSGHIIIDRKSGQRRGVPFQPSTYFHNVVNYTYTLPRREANKIKTIFGGGLASNIDWYAYESLTSFRVLMLEICTMLRDFSWQCTSLPIETELGFYLRKYELIKMSKLLNLPLEKTWTCSGNNKYQCGICSGCYVRKEGFKQAKVPDKTIYRRPESLVRKFKRHVKQIFQWN